MSTIAQYTGNATFAFIGIDSLRRKKRQQSP